MKHAFEQKVFYSDTDSYGVVWHGSYLKWLEMGRVLFCESKNLDIETLEKNDIVFPVAQINIKYKSPAKLNDVVVIETSISDYGKFYIDFKQNVIDKNTKKVYIDATVKVVAVNKSGLLYRSLPEQIKTIFV